MKISRPLLAVICACFVLSVSAQVSTKDKWLRLKTPNFTLVGNSSENDLRLVATKLEQFRTTFGRIFPSAKLTSSIPTNVIVFKSSSSYKPYKPKRGDGKADEWIAGYFQAGEDVNYITLSTEGEKADTYGTIFHEYVHSLLNTTFGKSSVPPWFNEGLAEYYQTFQIEEDQKAILGNLQDEHLRLLQQTKLIPLDQFFAIDNYSLHRNANHSRSIFYAQAWALIHYLIQGNGGANVDGLGKFLGQVMKNVAPEKAFQSSFGMDYATMEKALKKYVEQRTFRGTSVTFDKKLVFDADFVVTPISEATANAYLGDLLYHTHEYPDADAHLQKALQLDANLSMAHTSLGLVKMRQKNFPEAKKYLERAIADDQKNHFAHYSYAYVLSREGMDEFGYITKYPAKTSTKMRASLLRSIELNPEFPENYRLLAFVNMISGENLDESLAALKKGIALQPGNQHYSLLMAQIYMRQEKFDDAKALVERLAKTADDESLRTSADRMLASINQYTEAKRESERQMQILNAGGNGQSGRPVFVRRETMTEEQFAKLDRDREIRNLNQVLTKPEEGEKLLLGNIEKIECAKGEVVFSFRSADGPMTLLSKDFQSLKLEILREGTNDISIGCGAEMKDELIAITYRPADAKLRNILTGLSFVPKDFRLMSAEEMARVPNLIVQGGPPTDTAKNAEIAAGQMAEMEKRRREMMLQQIERALRRPVDGETRVLGTLDKIECSGKATLFNFNTPAGVIKLKAPEQQNQLKIVAFTQDASGVQFGCGASLPNVSAVVTYRPATEKKSKTAGDLIAVEFVPKSFELIPAEN